MMKTALTSADIEAQAVLELPDRELLGGALVVLYAPVTVYDLSIIENVANHTLNNWHISVLDHNKVDVDVDADVDVTLFCNQIVTVLSAQCFKK
jgi:hypothetical protein